MGFLMTFNSFCVDPLAEMLRSCSSCTAMAREKGEEKCVRREARPGGQPTPRNAAPLLPAVQQHAPMRPLKRE